MEPARILRADVVIFHGVMHVIDTVLLPKFMLPPFFDVGSIMMK
jgi:hypothetical protein